MSDCTCTIIRPMQREIGSGVPISPPEWEQADDCPTHPHLLYCETCGTQSVVLETSEEASVERPVGTSGAVTAERQWLTTRLACGHVDEIEMTSGGVTW